MANAPSFWWQALKKGGDVLANVGEEIVGEKLKGQIEDRLKPILKLLESPQARQAFQAAFEEASQEFERGALTGEERQLRREVCALLGRTTRKGVPDASREVIQRYVLASEPNRIPLDRWVQRQLGGGQLTAGDRVYSQEEVTLALDAFFQALNRAFWEQPLFRDQVAQAGTTQLLRQVLDALRTEADVESLRADYLDYLRRHLAYLDLGGIAPKVANRTVKLPMQEIYVPVEAWRELDVQQAWQQVRTFLAHAKGVDLQIELDSATPAAFSTFLEAFADSLADDTEASAWRAFQERLAPERPAKEAASVKDIFAAPRAVLLGHPGTGKSTTLKYAAYAVAAGQGDLVGEAALERLPILVRLVDYAKALDADPTLRLRDYVRDLHDKDRAPLFRHSLEKGECLVMLDGLDEVVDPQQRAEIADQVEALVADYPDNHYLLASRVVGYEAGRLTGDFTHFTLGPLPQASIHGFVQKWYEAIEREGDVEASEEVRARADELCQAIEERPGIRRLAENPLLLTIIALVNWKGRKLPNRRVEVYRHAAETLVESWPRVRRGVIFDWEEVLNLLEPVAYRIFGDRSSEGITQGELLPLLAQAVAEIKPGMTQAAAGAYVADLLPRLSEHSGLFLEQGFDPQSGERIFGFLHLTFAEYLAARYLAGKWEAEQEGGKRRAFLARYAHVPRWREVVLLMVEHVGLDGRRVPATQMLADLLQMETPYEEHLQRNLLLAGQCLADDLRVEPAASDWVLDQLAARLLETPIGPLREGIAALAQEMAGTAYEGELVGRLLARLEDDNAELRDSAAWVLGQIGHQRAVEGLLARLEDDSAAVRASAAGALGRVGDGRAVTGLLACLEDDSAEVRAGAAWALEQIKSEQVVKGLLARLEDDSPAVRDRAAWVLGRIGDERAVEGLLIHLEDDSAAVRARAAGALGEIKSEPAAEGLLARLEDNVAAVRARAAGALGRIGDERVVAGLLIRLEDDNAEVRASAAWALGEIESKRAVAGLLARLEDDVAAVRASVAGALGRIGDEQAVAGLLARLEDDAAAVRARAAWALGRIGGERAAEGLLARLEDDSAEVCDSAAWALSRIGDERAVAGLLSRLEDDSPTLRASAAWALGRIGDEQAVKGLLPWLEDSSADVRASAAWALGRIGGERSVAGLLVRLEDASPAVRASAARALGEIKSRRALAGLLARLEDDAAEVRDSAAWALGCIGDERVVEHLLPWLSRAEVLSFILERACDWAYTTILEILAYHVSDPGVVPQSPSPEPVVVGPWSQA